MALTRIEAIALGGAVLVALATPVALLMRSAPEVPPASAAPLLARASGPADAPDRPLFALSGEPPQEGALPQDAPELVGIVGRIGRDAVALVRGAAGSRTLAVGDSIDGWRLESLAIDAAFFTRGAERLRVPLPAGDQ